jgi:hypothetical protein
VGVIAAFTRAVGADADGVAKPANAQASPLLPAASAPGGAAVRAAAAALGCDAESCVLAHPAFRRFVAGERLLPRGALDLELEARFKAKGPRAGTGLLSNYNIDETLLRWARVFPEFHPCPFAMMDFERTDEPLARADLAAVHAGRAPLDLGPALGAVRRPAACFGCVLNTDVSSGPGKHWVALFADMRPPPGGPWTVEYFNSTGRPPPRPVVKWMENARARLAEYRAGLPECRGHSCEVATVSVTDIDHQESQTECGLYALFYIRRRLEGAPYTDFLRQPIPDRAMTAFRAHVFRAA